MRDKDSLILENLYFGMLFEFTEKTIQKLIAKFHKEDPNLSEAIIKSYLDRFEKVKSSPKVKKKDPFQYTWKELENFLDANFPPEEEKVSSEEDEKEKLKVYDKENVTIYHAKNPREAQILGDGFTFCISRKGSGNMFSNYRLNYESSFYFIRLHDKSGAKEGSRFVNPLHYIVLDINGDGRIQMTGADNGGQGNGTAYIDKGRLLEKFPELEEPFEEGVFKKMPLTEEEKEKYKKFKELERLIGVPLDFQQNFQTLKYSEKKEYLQSGYDFPATLFAILDKPLRADYLNNGPILDTTAIDKLNESEKNRWLLTFIRKREGYSDNEEEQWLTYLLTHLIRYKPDEIAVPDILMGAILKYIKRGKVFREPLVFINSIEGKQRDIVWNARLNNDAYFSDKEKEIVQKHLPEIYKKYESIVRANSKMRLKRNNFDNMHEEEVEYITKNKLASEEQILDIVDKKLLPDAYSDLAAKVFQNIDFKKHIPRILDIFDQQTFKYENDKIYFQEWQGDFGSFLQDIQDYVDQDDYKSYLPYYIGDESLDIDVPYNTLDSNTIEGFLDKLQTRKPDLYKTLDAHMRLLYKEQNDETAEEDGYDLEDIIEQGLDEDIKTAFFRAYTSAMEYGASSEIYKEFQSFVKELPFNYDEGEGGSVRGYLTPEQLYELIIVPESLEVLYNGENVLEILKQEGEFPKFNVPYYGFDGYDEDAGLETLISELEDALP
jgi:hypothetical protein